MERGNYSIVFQIKSKAIRHRDAGIAKVPTIPNTGMNSKLVSTAEKAPPRRSQP